MAVVSCNRADDPNLDSAADTSSNDVQLGRFRSHEKKLPNGMDAYQLCCEVGSRYGVHGGECQDVSRYSYCRNQFGDEHFSKIHVGSFVVVQKLIWTKMTPLKRKWTTKMKDYKILNIVRKRDQETLLGRVH